MTAKAFAYLRTSSATNVGENKDSDRRQRLAIEAFAKANGLIIAAEFYDADTKGAEPSISAQPSARCLRRSLATVFAPSSSRPSAASPAI